MEKGIELCKKKAGEIKNGYGFGNPRKISKKKLEELRSINIRDNTHAGEWDLELLAD